MKVSYTCRQCERRVNRDTRDGEQWTCPHCHAAPAIPEGPEDADHLTHCAVCGCQQLFVRKDFSQRLGVAIVVLGLSLSTIAWGFHWRYTSYAILFGSALIDVAFYLFVGNVLQCYRCRAEYREVKGLEEFDPFDLETHERFRQQAIRMAQAKKA